MSSVKAQWAWRTHPDAELVRKGSEHELLEVQMQGLQAQVLGLSDAGSTMAQATERL